MPTELLKPILEGGIRNTHFFQGRLLTAEDLRTEQNAVKTHCQQLGQAIGTGIVEGLEVTVESKGSKGASPVIKVTQGMALNAKGQTVALPQDETISLSRSLKKVDANTQIFSDCKPPTNTQLTVGVGVYILVMSPVSGFRERAPMSGLQSGDGKLNDCGSRYVVEGVQFRLEQLHPTQLSGISSATRELLQKLLGAKDPASLSKLQNVLAHLCFGTEQLAGFAINPFERKNSPLGALGDMRQLKQLTDCDVPLALFYWTLDGIAFLDLWSVRRRPFTLAPTAKWPSLVGQRRAAEAEAMFLQFQDHLEQLQREQSNIRAKDYFRYLPSVGFLPLGQSAGFSVSRFFKGKTYREPISFINGARIDNLIGHAFEFPAIDMYSQEMIWLYSVRENKQGSNEGTSYLIFANGHIPYQAEAQYNLAHWNYANFAEDMAKTVGENKA